MYRNIPLHFEVLLEAMEGAVILAQSVHFQNIILDAQIIAATQDAARLYGFNHHAELEGKFTSQLDHPDDYQAVKIMALVRYLQLSPTPSEYNVRIVLPDGSIRHIRKSVKQMTHEGDTYWVTRSTEIRADEYIPPPDFRHLLTENVAQQWFNLISIAELEQLAKAYIPVRNARILPHNLTSDEIHPMMDEIHTGDQMNEAISKVDVLPTTMAEGAIDIGLGRTRRLPDNRFIHRCGNCAETWASQVRNPKKCPRSRADSRGPQCGTNRWRVTTDRGLRCARQQASGAERAPDETR